MRRILLALLMIIPSAVMADGTEPSAKDDPVYKSDQPMFRERTSFRETYSDTLRSHLTASERAELKRMHKRAMARMKADREVFSRTTRKTRVAEPVAYVSDLRDCKAPIEVTGHERLGRGRAAQSALNAWRTAASDRFGFRFGDVSQARGNTTPDCVKVRGDTFGVYVCQINARPCRSR